MANEIKAKYSTPAALTITLASLASSTGGTSARQSTLVDNSTTRYRRILLQLKVKLGTSPTTSRLIYPFLIRGDGTNRTDGAGASDAALTIRNAQLLGPPAVTTSTTGEVIQADYLVDDPGPEWGVAIGHDTAVNLDATGGNHAITWVGVTDEVQ